uniref:lipopolysaccharide biosynthesis protein n=1 Tax=Thaumasiovibrio occultus TaxID=1891184 RepID=UPI000B34DE88|nr:lipopolysaccharide biosynthesis protein [Thaumasiovibrio occultus]
MTTHTTELRFQQFKNEISEDQFSSIEFLMAKAEQIEATDPELSARILVRVNNLRKQQATISRRLENNSVEKNPQHKQNLSKTSSNVVQKVSRLGTMPFVWLVLLPTLVFGIYQAFWASERFVSRAQVIVQQPDGMATMDASMAVLTGLGVSNTGVADTELVKAYILSNDMLMYLEETLELRQHFSQNGVDVFSRVGPDDEWEALFDYYLTRIDVYIDSNSNIVYIETQAFDPDFAHTLTQTIVERAEWYINSIGHQLAEAQLTFIQHEHANIERRLQDAQTGLMQFQQRYNLLDPMAEGMALQQITYGLEGQISAKEAELKGLLTMMSPRAPKVIAARNSLEALKSQLEKERGKLSDGDYNTLPVSEILTQYTDLKIKTELALQAYTSSQISLEKSRIEAYRQLKYLVVVEAATKPHDAKYPDVFYNITLFGVLATMLFVIGRIIVLTVNELK